MKKSIFASIILIALFLAIPASAQVIGTFDFLKGLVPCGTSYAPEPCTACHLFKLIQNLINFFLFLSAPVATIIAVYAGFLFVTSGGSPARIGAAKKALWSVVGGVIIVLGSWLLIGTILNVVASPSAFPWPWNRIECRIPKSSFVPSGNVIHIGEGDGQDTAFVK